MTKLDPEKTRERELLLRRVRELDQELAENQRELWELKKRQASRLPLEKQLAFYLQEHLNNTSRSKRPLLAGSLCGY